MKPEQEKIAHLIARSLPSPVFAVDEHRTVSYLNEAMEQLSECTGDAACGKLVPDWLPYWTPEADAALTRCLEAGVSPTVQLRQASSTEGARALSATFVPLRGDDESIVGASVMLRPAPSQGQDPSRMELAESDHRFRTMADCAPVLLWMSGTDGLCTFFNQPWLDFTGRTMEMEIGNGWAEGVHPEDLQHCMALYLNAFVARREFRMEYRLRRADGAYRWLLDTGIPHWVPDGAFAGYIGSCIDITDIKEIRSDLNRKVRERTAELEAFAYSVSHDLRAPLRAIAGFGRELLDDYGGQLDERGHHYLDRMCQAASRMSRLIDGLLALSRITRDEIARERVDLTEISLAIASELREREPSRNVALTVDQELVTMADARLVRALLDNVLGNAWKFTKNRAEARIEVGRLRDAFFVKDNGAGFDMQHARKLFSAFHRLHSESQFEGTGIGLATVQRIVSRHGGRVWVEAAPDRGATVFFTLEGNADG